MIGLKAATSLLVVVGPLAAGGIAASTASAAEHVGSCFAVDDYDAGTPGDCYQLDNTFSESGVAIWDSAYNHATVNGTGQAGEVFHAIGFTPAGDSFACDNGVTTTAWYEGTDTATGVSGWVPDCYLDEGPIG